MRWNAIGQKRLLSGPVYAKDAFCKAFTDRQNFKKARECESPFALHRSRRQVENPSGFQAGESRPILAIWKTEKIASCTPGRFCVGKSYFPEQTLERVRSAGFCVFTKRRNRHGANEKFSMRHPAGEILLRPPACQKCFLTSKGCPLQGIPGSGRRLHILRGHQMAGILRRGIDLQAPGSKPREGSRQSVCANAFPWQLLQMPTKPRRHRSEPCLYGDNLQPPLTDEIEHFGVFRGFIGNQQVKFAQCGNLYQSGFADF